MKNIPHYLPPSVLRIYRKVNLLRIAFSIVFVALMLAMNVYPLFFTALAYAVFSIFWFVQLEIALIDERRYPWTGYLPCLSDCIMMTLAVSLTGHLHSYLILGYPFIVLFYSLNPLRNIGLISVVFSALFFALSGVCIMYSFMPDAGFPVSGIHMGKGELILSVCAVAAVSGIVNRVVYPMSVKLWKESTVASKSAIGKKKL